MSMPNPVSNTAHKINLHSKHLTSGSKGLGMIFGIFLTSTTGPRAVGHTEGTRESCSFWDHLRLRNNTGYSLSSRLANFSDIVSDWSPCGPVITSLVDDIIVSIAPRTITLTASWKTVGA